MKGSTHTLVEGLEKTGEFLPKEHPAFPSAVPKTALLVVLGELPHARTPRCLPRHRFTQISSPNSFSDLIVCQPTDLTASSGSGVRDWGRGNHRRHIQFTDDLSHQASETSKAQFWGFEQLGN
ncbi:4-hydroxyphenylpyruvate dioxygenase [Manis javanica]|nr:4-hydroxyphenylpyruvate dioxygenase [Manis javanica]